MRRGEGRSRLKLGCSAAALVAVVALIVFGAAFVVARRQIRGSAVQSESSVTEVRETLAGEASARRLRLDLHTTALSVRPVDAGKPILVQTEYDAQLYRATQEESRDEQGELLEVRLVPVSSRLMALLRAKLGARLPTLRIQLPRDVPLEIEGQLAGSHAAMELGGLSLSKLDLDVTGGRTMISFAEQLAQPMDTLSVLVDRGSLSVSRLGNASPRRARLLEHLGGAELDLRGAWIVDSKVKLVGGAAGGSLWLPDNVTLRGVGDRGSLSLENTRELALPVLELQITEHMSRFVIID